MREYEITEKAAARARNTFRIFVAGTVILWAYTLFSFLNGNYEVTTIVSSIVVPLLAVVYYFYPKRVKFVIANNTIDYCDGFTTHKKIPISDIRTVAYRPSRNSMMIVTRHYHKTKINFVFEGYDDVLALFSKRNISMKNSDKK